MTYEKWAQEHKTAEHIKENERDPWGYYAALDFLDKLERMLGRG